jgi:hypothetical protein
VKKSGKSLQAAQVPRGMAPHHQVAAQREGKIPQPNTMRCMSGDALVR